MKPVIMKRKNKNGYVYRIVIKYENEYGVLTSKETTFKPTSTSNEMKALAYAEIFADDFLRDTLNDVEIKKAEIEKAKLTGNTLSNITFKELCDEWLDSKYDKNNPNKSTNFSYKYYLKCQKLIEEFNKEFGYMHVKDITHDVIYKYYKKVNKGTKIRIVVNAKPELKTILKDKGLSHRKILAMYGRKSINIQLLLDGANIEEKTAQKFCEVTGVPFVKGFDKRIIETDYSESSKFERKKLLKAIFTFAKDSLRIINDNPANDNTLIKSTMPTKRRESFSEEQAVKFYETTKEFDMMIQTAMHMSLLTGMRPAEMGGLEWRDIDFSYKTITIERNAIDCGAKLGILIKGTKTNRSRTISIPEVLVEQLIKYRKWQDELKERYGDYFKDEGQVFAKENGDRITTHTFGKWFKLVRDKANLPSTFTLYNLRHTNLSILVGYVPITTVAKRAGHTTIKTTEEYYIHRVSEADIKASEKLNNVFESAYQEQNNSQIDNEIKEYREALDKMKLLGFKTLQEYFEYLKYMKSKGFDVA